MLNLPVFLVIRDADDPTANDRTDNGPDNWGTGDPIGVKTLHTSVVGGGADPTATATFDYTTSMNPGDNYRFAVSGHRFSVADAVTAKIGDNMGRVVFDDDVIIDENNPMLMPFTNLPIVISSPLVSVWRRLHVEMDSMAAPQPGTQFTATDPSPGGPLTIPSDAMETLTESLQPAFILPEVLSTESENDLPFSLGALNQADLDNYMYSHRQSMSPTKQEDSMFWTVYIAAIYEMFAGDGYANDNDPDDELAYEGYTKPAEPEYSVINMEVIRDVGASGAGPPIRSKRCKHWSLCMR